MPPHKELNERFHGYQRNANRLLAVRRGIIAISLIAAAAATLHALPSSAVAERIALPQFAAIRQSIVGASQDAIAFVQSRNANARINIAHGQSAAAGAAGNVADAINGFFGWINGGIERTGRCSPRQ
jgi:hypothetical protein